MKRIILLLIIAAFISAPLSKVFAQDKLNAKIGVLLESQEKVRRMKSNDRVFAGDYFKVFVNPQNDAYVYVILSDKNESMLLNAENSFAVQKFNTLILPDDEESFYQVDEKSDEMRIDVIVSIDKMDEIELLFKGKESVEKYSWVSLENTLTEDARLIVDRTPFKPIIMAGNVRSASNSFMKKLQKFSGDKVIMKKYVLEVKK